MVQKTVFLPLFFFFLQRPDVYSPRAKMPQDEVERLAGIVKALKSGPDGSLQLPDHLDTAHVAKSFQNGMEKGIVTVCGFANICGVNRWVAFQYGAICRFAEFLNTCRCNVNFRGF